MSYHLWGPGEIERAHAVIAYGLPLTTLDALFGDVREAGRIEHPLAMERERDMPIFVCRAPRRPLSEAWPELRAYGHGPGLMERHREESLRTIALARGGGEGTHR